MAQIKAEPVPSRFADDPRQHERGPDEIKIAKLTGISKIPKHTRAWTALDVHPFCVDRESGSSASNRTRHGQVRAEQLLQQRSHRRERALAFRSTGRQIAVVNVTIVSVQPAGLQIRQAAEKTI